MASTTRAGAARRTRANHSAHVRWTAARRSSARSHARWLPEICSATSSGMLGDTAAAISRMYRFIIFPKSTGRMRVLDLGAGVGERVRGAAQQAAVLRVDGARVVVEPRRDPEPGQ